VRRDRVVSVRLEPRELAAWRRGVEASAWRSLAHWCREVVGDALSRSPLRSGVSVDVAEEDAAGFAGLCAVLNARARDSNRLGAVVGDSLAAARAVVERAGSLVPDPASAGLPVWERDRRTELVNVRLSEEELAVWQGAADAAGYGRVATWVRHMVDDLVGVRREAGPRPGEVGVRRQLAGAVNNLGQLADLAGTYDQVLAGRLAPLHEEATDLLARYHQLGGAR
jgi:hypothetical protein